MRSVGGQNHSTEPRLQCEAQPGVCSPLYRKGRAKHRSCSMAVVAGRDSAIKIRSCLAEAPTNDLRIAVVAATRVSVPADRSGRGRDTHGRALPARGNVRPHEAAAMAVVARSNDRLGSPGACPVIHSTGCRIHGLSKQLYSFTRFAPIPSIGSRVRHLLTSDFSRRIKPARRAGKLELPRGC